MLPMHSCISAWVMKTLAVNLHGIWPEPQRDNRSVTTLAIPERIANLKGRAEIFQLHQLIRSIVDFDAITRVDDELKIY